MRAYVYTDKSLERYAGRFVWLSVNTEDKANAAFLRKYPIPALPTQLVLDAKRDNVALRYVGGATVAQLRSMLDEAEKTYSNRAVSAADKLLAKADDYASKGDYKASAASVREAMAAAPKSWPRYGRAAEALILSLAMGGALRDCAETALDLYPRVKGTVPAATVASTGLGCVSGLDEKAPRHAELASKLHTYTREVFDDPKIVVSNDDRSGLYIVLIESEQDPAAKRKLQEEWSAFLDDAAAHAKTPQERAVYDSHRLSAYLDLGTPEKAVPFLEQAERDFPDDYNPPARLALAYKAMKEYDKAIAASDRALKHVEGPRRLTVLTARADIFVAKGDMKGAKEAIEQAVAYAKSLPEGQRSDRRIASLEKRLASMQ
jgi:tetratricopeptide (TPR) repeat protein